MNILIACDSFKDALDSLAVCQAVERGLGRANPRFQTRIFPLSDGGEGMAEVLGFHLGLVAKKVVVQDPLHRKITAQYGLSRDGNIAFIEMAQAAGLQLLANDERDPLKTSTFGVGELIADALRQGANRIVLGIGGSATNDLGTGMAAALGWRFLDKNGAPVFPVGGNLGTIASVIEPPEKPFANAVFEVICDVQNPLLGATGAAKTYARQKGASEADIEKLEAGAQHFTKTIAPKDTAPTEPGMGAAGGLGFGARFFLNAALKPGIEAMMDLTQFDEQLAWADLIFTGEGRIDDQTAHGKLIAGIVARARPKKVIAFCGALEANPETLQAIGLWSAFSITLRPCMLAEALAGTAWNLEAMGFQVGRVLFTSSLT